MISNDPLGCLIHSPDPTVTLDQREVAREGDPLHSFFIGEDLAGSPEQMVKEVEREAGGPLQDYMILGRNMGISKYLKP